MIAEVNIKLILHYLFCCVRVRESVTCRSITWQQVVAGCSCNYAALSHGVNPFVQAPITDGSSTLVSVPYT